MPTFLVTVIEETTIMKTREFEADNEESAEEMASEEDWQDWEVADTHGDYSINSIEKVDA